MATLTLRNNKGSPLTNTELDNNFTNINTDLVNHIGASGTAHGVATQSVSGFMSSVDKTKLDGVAASANNYSLPTASTTVLGGVKVDGTTITINGSGVISGSSTYSLPIATSTVLGGVKDGTGLSIDGTGTLTVDYGSAAGTAVQGNDARVTSNQAAGTASIRTIGTGALEAAAGNHTHTLDNLSDVVITTPATNQLLQYNGTSWVNATVSTGSSITIANDTTTNATMYPALMTTTTGTATTVKTSDTKLTYNPSTGEVGAVSFNTTSDVTKKTNIQQIANATQTVEQLHGVEFDWVDNGNKSAGVIAQEIEKVLPWLVSETDGVKSVNYSGIIGYLIETVKELNQRILLLEQK